MYFASDNASGVAPEILQALAQANAGYAPSYGTDPWSQAAQARLREIFETDLTAFLVPSGTAANALSLSVLTPPYGAVLAYCNSHVQMDECGAPEFYTGGAKIVPLPGDEGKLTPAIIEPALSYLPQGVVHHVQTRTISITQATECGTVYSPEEVGALGELARAHGLSLHMDGARFANALVAQNCLPADLTWRAGVDVLVLGATKNGAMSAEAVLFFDADKAADFEFRRKRAGHLMSKGRFLGAQFCAWLEDDLWLRLARHANEMAARLADGLGAIGGVRMAYPVQANEVFAVLPEPVSARLTQAGGVFYRWLTPDFPGETQIFRMVTSFATTREEVDAFCCAAKGEG